MDTRKPEVMVDPTESQRTEVAEMTGVTVPDSAAAVSVQTLGEGYRLGVIPGGTTGGAELVTEESDQPAPAETTAPESSKDDSLAAISRPLLRAGEAGLIGPPGASWGTRSIYMPFTGGFTMTAADFKYHVGETQEFSSSCESTFHVYWVDGEPPSPPYYLIILRQRAIFGVSKTSKMLHDAEHIRGFGLYSAKTEVRNVRSTTNQVELNHVSPAGNGRVANVSENVRMTQEVQGGKDFAAVTLQEGAELTLEQWTAYNRSAPPDAKWEFAYNNTLDGGLNGTALVSNHYSGQTVKSWPPNTTGGLTARTYAVWRVRGGKDATFTFGLELLQSFMLLTRGWLRQTDARGGILTWGATGLQPYSLNLREIARVK
jgi:hypothetical protein